MTLAAEQRVLGAMARAAKEHEPDNDVRSGFKGVLQPARGVRGEAEGELCWVATRRANHSGADLLMTEVP